MKKLLVYISIFCLLTGCAAPATAPSFASAKATESRENRSVFYIYREYAEPTAWNTTIHIDDKEVVSLPQQSFSWVYLTPGKHKVASKWPFLSGQNDVEFSVEAAPDKTYFYEITGLSRATGVGPSPAGLLIYYKMSSGMSGQEEAKAVPQLESCCRYLAPKLDDF